MKTGTWGLNCKNSKNLSKVVTLKNLNFKILSMQDIKLAQMRPGASSALYRSYGLRSRQSTWRVTHGKKLLTRNDSKIE
jgi:hypothetical protein